MTLRHFTTSSAIKVFNSVCDGLGHPLAQRGVRQRRVYHAWNYELDGKLKGVAFRNGVRGHGGMPKDFNVADHRLLADIPGLPRDVWYGSVSDRNSRHGV